ncbi:MAG: DUF3090 family protein [Acidimicrobiia bacterium]|nr:DUF3090 family protein [Acidimicrobiia bacterium]
MNASFHFDEIERFTAGTIGPKGQRVFYLQADVDDRIISLKVEKQQVSALAEYLARLLEDVPATNDELDAGDLDESVLPEWTAGPLGVAYDEAADRIVVVAEELVEDESDDAATARFGISRAQAHAFVARARDVVAAGRAPCPYCGRPLEPGSTWCPCHN